MKNLFVFFSRFVTFSIKTQTLIHLK